MIGRIVKFVGIGLVLGLLPPLLNSSGVLRHFLAESLILFIAPMAVLWFLFRPLFASRPTVRLFGLILVYTAPILVMLFVFFLSSGPLMGGGPPGMFVGTIIGTVKLVSQAALIPLVLSTPSPVRSFVRLGCFVLLYVGFSILIDLIGNSPTMDPYYAYWIYYKSRDVLALVAIFAALAPDHIAMERAARARKMPTNCEKCEYDLTANVSGVCPECGTTLSEALRQHLHRRGENAWGAEQVPAMEMDRE